MKHVQRLGPLVTRHHTMRNIARNPTFIRVVEMKALIGGGETVCASTVTVCIGKSPIFVL